MIVDANVSDDELGRTQSHRDHYGAPVASRDSQRQGMVWRRVRHYLAVQILLAWSLLGAALQSCALDAVYVSEVHVHACCMPSRAARAKEVLMEVEASCAEHGAVASASPRDGSWQLQVHLLIARRTARVRSGCLSGWRHASSLSGDSYEVRSSSRAHSPTGCVRARMRNLWTDGTAFGVEACRREDLIRNVTYSQIYRSWGCGYPSTVGCERHGTAVAGLSQL